MSIFAACRFYRRFSSSISFYPVPRDLLSGSLPRSNFRPNVDRRGLELLYTVSRFMYLGDLDTAAEYARLVNSKSYPQAAAKTCENIIGAMCEAKRYRDAMDLYHYFFNELKIGINFKSSSHIIEALCEIGRVDDALVLFRAVLSSPRISYGILTKALVDAGRLDEALCLLREYPMAQSCSNLISGFLNLGNLGMADKLLKEFETNGFWAENPYECRSEAAKVRVAFMEYWFKQGKDEEALRWYQSLIGNDKFQFFGDSGNTLIQLLLKYGKKTEAWEVFHRMLDGTCTVDPDAIDIMVKVCFEEGRFSEGIETFHKVKAKLGYWKRQVYCNVIRRCCEHGMLKEAECLFAELSSLSSLDVNVLTYRAMMDAYIKAERVDDALQMANNIITANLKYIALWIQV